MTAPNARPAHALACGRTDKPSIFEDVMRANGLDEALEALRELLACHEELPDPILEAAAKADPGRWFGCVSPKMARAILKARRVGAGT